MQPQAFPWTFGPSAIKPSRLHPQNPLSALAEADPLPRHYLHLTEHYLQVPEGRYGDVNQAKLIDLSLLPPPHHHHDNQIKIIDFGASCDMSTGINFNPLYGMLDPRYSPPEELVMPSCECGGGGSRAERARGCRRGMARKVHEQGGLRIPWRWGRRWCWGALELGQDS